MSYIINLPAEFEEIYILAAKQLDLSIEDFLQEALINYIVNCLH